MPRMPGDGYGREWWGRHRVWVSFSLLFRPLLFLNRVPKPPSPFKLCPAT